MLTASATGNAEELGQMRSWPRTPSGSPATLGDLGTAETLTGHAEALAVGSDIPHRQANTLFCRGLLRP